ncbi:MAG: hypothetical protein ACR2PM_02690 [Hyphomicrobiales bacterium]
MALVDLVIFSGRNPNRAGIGNKEIMATTGVADRAFNVSVRVNTCPVVSPIAQAFRPGISIGCHVAVMQVK